MTPTELDDQDRYGFHRGPCRGDGDQHRPAAWHRERAEALTRSCPYVTPSPAARRPGQPKPEPLACGAGIGELCRDPIHGYVLSRQSAHDVRKRPSIPDPRPEATDR